MKKTQFTTYLKDFNFIELFNELGWDNFDNKLPIAVNDDAFELNGIAVKKGFVILSCPPYANGKIPLSNIRKQIELKVAKNYFEHLIIFYDKSHTQQIWQLTIKEENKPKQVREVSWFSHQDVEVLFQRLKNLLFTLDEEEKITIIDVKQRISENFAKNTDQVTKKFYTEFKKQHVAFLDFIQGIDDHIGNKENENKQWYASLMLNRLMFCYFIQKKGFLDQDVHYLQNKLKECEKVDGSTNFYSFYRSFLLELFHDGLGKPLTKRKQKLTVDLGKIPYLNGGLFDVHELERQFEQIHIEDDAFKRIFSFFDQWNWHLDNSIEATGKDINPDVIGYIFEKYINDRAAMGAYYTKEDITDYIGKNTILPYLFDETERNYKEAFKKDGIVWQFLKESADTYIYEAVKHGISSDIDLFADLPPEVQAGINHPLEHHLVKENTSTHLWEIRQAWNQKVPAELGLPTEIYRELIERRSRYSSLRSKIEKGQIESINDFITFNLDIRQFSQDFIENTTDAVFIQNFYKAISAITILDPTCGSGAFLFASLNILEPLYEACIIRMEQFVSEQPGKFKYFEQVLKEVNDDKHPSLQYFIFKSIILNNLYGVDIMHEAVEIAKLRLFLKLVTTVEVNPTKENFGLEPLPDIDFNIRAGNTLIGFATVSELLKTIQQKDGMFADERLEEFLEQTAEISQLFKRFQDDQLISDQGSDSFKTAKAHLVLKLKELNHKLNVYLATNYGIDAVAKPKEFQSWLKSHQPFHWFAEFYQIVAVNNGFSCIIGNPPYVEYSSVRKKYIIQNIETIDSGNLYAYVIERSLVFQKEGGYNGMIIQMSAFCTPRMSSFQSLWLNNASFSSLAFFDDRPGKLFDGLEHIRVVINILRKGKTSIKINTTGYIKFYSEHRQNMFQNINYTKNDNSRLDYCVLKVSSDKEHSIISKLWKSKFKINTYELPKGKNENYVYYGYGYGYFGKILNHKSYFWGENVTESTGDKYYYLQLLIDRDIVVGLMNSSLFYWYYINSSDGHNFTKTVIGNFPFEFNDNISYSSLVDCVSKLMLDLDKKANRKIANYKSTGRVEYDEYFPKKSKNIIDQIDSVLAKYYDFTEVELDFIINYDIKYRMGKSLFGEVEDDVE